MNPIVPSIQSCGKDCLNQKSLVKEIQKIASHVAKPASSSTKLKEVEKAYAKLKQFAEILPTSDRHQIKANLAKLPKECRRSLYSAVMVVDSLKNKKVADSQYGQKQIWRNPFILQQPAAHVIDVHGKTLVEQLLHSTKKRRYMEWQKECVRILKEIKALTKKSKPDKKAILRAFAQLPKKLQEKMIAEIHATTSGKKGEEEFQSNPLLLSRLRHSQSKTKKTILNYYIRIETDFQERCSKAKKCFADVLRMKPATKKSELSDSRLVPDYEKMGLSKKELTALAKRSLDLIDKRHDSLPPFSKKIGFLPLVKKIKGKAPITDPYFLVNYADGKDKERAKTALFEQLMIDLGIPRDDGVAEGYDFDAMAAKILMQFLQFSRGFKLFSSFDLETIFYNALTPRDYSSKDLSYYEKIIEEIARHPNRPVLLMSGTVGHATMTILMGPYVIHIDTDNRENVKKGSSITVYKRNKELSVKILANCKGQDSTFEEKILIKTLGLKPVASIDKKYQKMGTCTKSSVHGALLALLVLENLLRAQKKERSPIDLDQAKIDQVYDDAYKVYKTFTTKGRLRNIKLFIQYLQENLAVLDQDLSSKHWALLEGIATKLAIFNRSIKKNDALEMVSLVDGILDRTKRVDREGIRRIRGSFISFLKQAKISRDHKLYLKLKARKERSEKSSEALGARHALQMVLRSNRHDTAPFLEQYLKFYDINEQDALGHTPIFYAASFASLETLHLLIDKGARVDLKDKNGRNPLHWAAAPRQHTRYPLARRFSSSAKQIEEVCKKLCQINGSLLNEEDEEGNTPLDCLLKRDSWPLIKFFVKKGAQLHSKKRASNLFAAAIAHKDKQLIEKLLNERKKKLIELDLISANYDTQGSYFKTSPIVWLLQHGDLALLKQSVGDTPTKKVVFTILQESHSPQITQWVIDTFSLEDLDQADKNTLLRDAVDKNQPDLLKKLIKRGALLPKDAWMPLIHSAITCGNKQIVDVLISRFPKLKQVKHPIDHETAEERILRRKRGEKAWKA